MWQKLNQRKNTASSLLAFIYLSMQLLNILMTAGKASSLWYFPARHNILDNLFKSLYIRCEVLVYVRCSISTAAAKCWGNSPPLFLLYKQPPAHFLLNAVTEGLGEISPSLYWEGPGSTTVYRTALPRLFFFSSLWPLEAPLYSLQRHTTFSVLWGCFPFFIFTDYQLIWFSLTCRVSVFA